MLDKLLPYYERELSFLREDAKKFAEYHKNKEIIQQLSLQGSGICPDPHIERLIESFAFIAARIHYKLDDDFPELTQAILDILFPHYLKTIPAMTIAEFQPTDSTRFIPRHTLLETKALVNKNMRCTFSTCYPVELWPIKVSHADITKVKAAQNLPSGNWPKNTVALLSLAIETLEGVDFAALPITKLRFFLDGEETVTYKIYELLCKNPSCIFMAVGSKPTDMQFVRIENCIQPVGFASDEGMLPHDDRSFLGYRLLQEYFVFPQKFLFVDITSLNAHKLKGSSLKITIPLQGDRDDNILRMLIEQERINEKTFRLGCSPIINLIPKKSVEAKSLIQQRFESSVIPDLKRPYGFEIFSIDRVELSINKKESQSIEIPAFFGHRHSLSDFKQAFWFCRRKACIEKGNEGIDLQLTLVDENFRPLAPEEHKTISILATCSNRNITNHLTATGELLFVDSRINCKQVSYLFKPTHPIRPNLDGSERWRLISHLTINQTSLLQRPIEDFQELLGIYNQANSKSNKLQIANLKGISCEQHLAQMGHPPKRFYAKCLAVSLEFDSEENVFLFASVLERFFGLYSGLNSFVQLTVKTKNGVLKQWPPRSAEAIIA